jgi:hypothetical protein
MTWPVTRLVTADSVASDTVDLTADGRWLLCVADGSITFITTGGDTVTLAMTAGVDYPIAIKRVKATGLTAAAFMIGW